MQIANLDDIKITANLEVLNGFVVIFLKNHGPENVNVRTAFRSKNVSGVENGLKSLNIKPGKEVDLIMLEVNEYEVQNRKIFKL